MSKQNGLGMTALVGGYDLSGDIGAIDRISGTLATLDVTAINKSAHERLYGQRDSSIEFTSFFNSGAGQEHAALKGLPTADVHAMVLIPALAVGGAAVCQVGKQVSYDPTRAADGGLTEKVQLPCNGYGMEWGNALTAGLRTDTAATNGTALDNAGPSYWGAQCYLQVTAATVVDVTMTVQQSADNSTWITLGSAFTQVTSAPNTQRVTTAAAQTFTATNANPCVFTVPGSAYANGVPVALSGSSLPTGFSASTVYYVVASSGSTFELSATSGGAAIASSSTGSGTVTPAVLRYLRAITSTSGGMTTVTFAVAVNRNSVATVF